MLPLRALLFAVFLLVAQMATGMHVLEHEQREDSALPEHVCELCLAAHALGAGIPSMVPPLPVLGVSPRPEVLSSVDRDSLPPPPASQRAPPLA